MSSRRLWLGRRTLGLVVLLIAVLAFAIARLKPPAAKPSVRRAPPRVLARATASTGWAYAWDIAVSDDGLVRIQSDPAAQFAQMRMLGAEELRDFIARLEEERPWELSSDLGRPVWDGPERRLEFELAGRHARVTLRQTPEGLTPKSLETSRLDLPRAIRLCEAIRALAHDDSLRSCIDGPLSAQRRSDKAMSSP